MIATVMDLSLAFGVFTAAANHAECDELAPAARGFLRDDYSLANAACA